MTDTERPMWRTLWAGNAWSDPQPVKNARSETLTTTDKPALLSFSAPPDKDHDEPGQVKLWCVHPAGQDGDLHYTGSITGIGDDWDTDTYLPKSPTLDGPALAAFQGTVCCVHTNTAGTDYQWTTATSTHGTLQEPPRLQWDTEGSQPTGLPGAKAPALGVVTDQLLCLFTVPESGYDPALKSASYDRNNQWWEPPQPCRGARTTDPPALALFHGRLVGAWHGTGNELTWSSYASDIWAYPKPARTAQGNPLPARVKRCSLAAYGDKLFCVYTDADEYSTDAVMYTIMHVPKDGDSLDWDRAYWTGPWPVTTKGGEKVKSAYGPALTLHAGALHCVFDRIV